MRVLLLATAAALLLPGASFDDMKEGQYWELVLNTGKTFRVKLTDVKDPLVHFTYSEPGSRESGHQNREQIDWLKSRMLDEQTHLSRLRRLEEEAVKEEEARMIAEGKARVILADGSRAWRPKDEVDLARNARDMDLERRRERRLILRPPEESTEPAPGGAAEGPPEGTPGFLTLWGPDILLAMAALAVVGVLVKTMVLGRSG